MSYPCIKIQGRWSSSASTHSTSAHWLNLWWNISTYAWWVWVWPCAHAGSSRISPLPPSPQRYWELGERARAQLASKITPWALTACMHSRVGGRDERHVMSHTGARESRAALGTVRASSPKELQHFLQREEILWHLHGPGPQWDFITSPILSCYLAAYCMMHTRRGYSSCPKVTLREVVQNQGVHEWHFTSTESEKKFRLKCFFFKSYYVIRAVKKSQNYSLNIWVLKVFFLEHVWQQEDDWLSCRWLVFHKVCQCLGALRSFFNCESTDRNKKGQKRMDTNKHAPTGHSKKSTSECAQQQETKILKEGFEGMCKTA